MDKDKFKKLIRFEELHRTDDSYKFMHKAYLDCLLRGGKLRAPCFMYSVGQTTMDATGAKVLANEAPLIVNPFPKDKEIKLRRECLVDLFEKTKKEGYWEVESGIVERRFDKNGNEITLGAKDWDNPTIILDMTVRVTYFLDKKNDIKKLDPKNIEKLFTRNVRTDVEL